MADHDVGVGRGEVVVAGTNLNITVLQLMLDEFELQIP